MFCSKCGKEINDEAVVCIHCGCAVKRETAEPEERDWVVTLVLSWFLGVFGGHRFYTGHIGLGVAQLLTLGGCGVWALVDWICICFNQFNDAEGRPLKGYKKNVGIIVFAVGLVLTIFSFMFNFIIGLAAALGD